MSTLNPPRHEQQPSGQRRARLWVLTAAAAAVAVGVIISVAVPGSEEGPTVAAQPVDANTAIAQAYIEARNAYDADQARALVAENFSTTENFFSDLDGMESAFARNEVLGLQYADGQCEDPVPSGERTVRVHCDYMWTTKIGQITDYPPKPVEFDFRIVDGRIAFVDYGWDMDDYSTNVWEPWLDFLEEEHPEYAKRLDDDRQDVVDKALQQEPEYLELYEQSVRAQTD